MKIGMGIDTGGTCTDAVIYDFEQKKILAFAKTNTTKEDLSIGIRCALEELPRELVEKSQVLALSTTLATNACVEHKGGRGKLVFFGIEEETVLETGRENGLPMDDSMIFIPCETDPSGDVIVPPDWESFNEKIPELFADCDAVGIVEMYARKSGARIEKKAKRLIREIMDLPVVCGHELFAEDNIVKRGATTLLNARLISIIGEFTAAVTQSLNSLNLDIPFVIVRSDGSFMMEEFAKEHPVETLLCGPVSSVMGAVELTDEKNCVIVDIGGTTTDVAFVKDGVPQTVESGIRIGQWNTFVQGLFIDTLGLGGDSGVIVGSDQRLHLSERKRMPLCMAASKYPSLLKHLRQEELKGAYFTTPKKAIFLGLRDISGSNSYSEKEKEMAAALLHQPMTLGDLSDRLSRTVLASHLNRLVDEHVVIECGITPTDIMHIKGDFVGFEKKAAEYAVNTLARILRMTADEVCDLVYDQVKRKLYVNIARILIENTNPEIHKMGIGPQLELLLNQNYDEVKSGKKSGFLDMNLSTSASIIGVGAPSHIFLPEVGKLLGCPVVTSQYAKVANALGAIVGNVNASATAEIVFNKEDWTYTIFGGGDRTVMVDLEEAKAFAIGLVKEKARTQAVARGASGDVKVIITEEEDKVRTDYGPLFMGYKVTATAEGELDV